MKLDPKYFNLFAGTVAVFAFLAIFYFTISYSVTQKSDFMDTVGDGTLLYETWFTVVDVQNLVKNQTIADSTALNTESDQLVLPNSAINEAQDLKISSLVPGDSLQGSQFKGNFVIIDFWSTWSDPSIESHTELWNLINEHSEMFVVIAAGVRDADVTILEYATEQSYPFYYVQGTEAFQKLKVPGVPSQAIFMPSGSLLQLRVGYKSPQDYDVLRSAIAAYKAMDISEFKFP